MTLLAMAVSCANAVTEIPATSTATTTIATCTVTINPTAAASVKTTAAYAVTTSKHAPHRAARTATSNATTQVPVVLFAEKTALTSAVKWTAAGFASGTAAPSLVAPSVPARSNASAAAGSSATTLPAPGRATSNAREGTRRNSAQKGASAVVAAERRTAPRRLRRGYAPLAGLALALFLYPNESWAQSTIRQPGARTAYSVELEPHLFIGAFNPPGPGVSTGFGAGLRSTIELAPRGFLPKLNDSVGLGLGLDWVRYDSNRRGDCTRFEDGPNDTRICTEVDGGGDADYLILPVVMQWNFWLSRSWSAFGEPGMFFHVADDDVGFNLFSISGGGRWHFSEDATLTLRLGYPAVTIGVSFLL